MTHNIPPKPSLENLDEQESQDLHEKIDLMVNGKIRIVDEDDHLLMIYNPAKRSIEIKTPVGSSSNKGKVFTIPLDDIIRAGDGNAFSDIPVYIFRAETMEGKQ